MQRNFTIRGDTSGEKGIVQKIYEDLFTVDDEYIENKIEELGEEMGISGDYLKETTEMILSVYDENQKGDFIISWEPFYYADTLMIPSGDINFSKIERDNEAVQTIMFWVRLLLTFSIFSLLLRQVWFLILATLGVSTQIYEDTELETKTVTDVIDVDSATSYRNTTFRKGGNSIIYRSKG